MSSALVILNCEESHCNLGADNASETCGRVVALIDSTDNNNIHHYLTFAFIMISDDCSRFK